MKKQAAEITLRTVAFGSLEAGPWGLVLDAGGALVLIGPSPAHPAYALAPGNLSAAAEREDWRLESDRGGLEVSGESEPVALLADDERSGGFDQLCRVRGHAELDGTGHDVDVLGVRSVRAAVDLEACDSIRGMWTWFEPADGIALWALRPRKARGHGRDLLSATVLDHEAARAVADPRLSTVYDGAGIPSRAGLELWLDGEDQQYPRRAAGEVLVGSDPVEQQGLAIRAGLLRVHSRGAQGAGVYLLGRRS